jgi:hypothetical protein
VGLELVYDDRVEGCFYSVHHVSDSGESVITKHIRQLVCEIVESR